MNLSIRRSLSVLAMALLLTGTLAACGTESQDVEPTVTRVDVAGAPPTRTPTVPGGETPPSNGGAASPTAGGGGGQAGGGAPTTVEIDMVGTWVSGGERNSRANRGLSELPVVN